MNLLADGVKWGIIGAGDVCEVKSGPGLYKSNGSSVVAVMRRNGDLAADFAKRHGDKLHIFLSTAMLD